MRVELLRVVLGVHRGRHAVRIVWRRGRMVRWHRIDHGQARRRVVRRNRVAGGDHRAVAARCRCSYGGGRRCAARTARARGRAVVVVVIVVVGLVSLFTGALAKVVLCRGDL